MARSLIKNRQGSLIGVILAFAVLLVAFALILERQEAVIDLLVAAELLLVRLLCDATDQPELYSTIREAFDGPFAGYLRRMAAIGGALLFASIASHPVKWLISPLLGLRRERDRRRRGRERYRERHELEPAPSPYERLRSWWEEAKRRRREELARERLRYGYRPSPSIPKAKRAPIRARPTSLRTQGTMPVGQDRIVFGGREYGVLASVRGRVAGEEVTYHLVGRGVRFERWTRQGRLIPPWVTHWYQLPDHTVVYLRGSSEGITVGSLRERLSREGRGYDSVTPLIEAIGVRRGIRAARLPFDLGTPDGARLIAAALGDGCLSPHGSRTRFYYGSRDREAVEQVVEAARRVFGELHAHERAKASGVIEVAFTSRIVADCLKRAGVPVGRKALANPPLPLVIRHGDRDAQRAYLRQTFDDEGTVTGRYVGYKRSVDITGFLRPKHRDFLERKLEWKERRWPSGRPRYYIDVNEEVREQLKGAGMWGIIKAHPPRLTIEEQELLSRTFSIETMGPEPDMLYRTKDGYSVSWGLRTRSLKDTIRFKEEIGFSLSRKRERLEEALRK